MINLRPGEQHPLPPRAVTQERKWPTAVGFGVSGLARFDLLTSSNHEKRASSANSLCTCVTGRREDGGVAARACVGSSGSVPGL